MTQSIALSNDAKKIQYPWMLSQRDDLIYFLAPNLVAYTLYMVAAFHQTTLDAAVAVLSAIYAGNVIHQGATWFHFTDKRNRDYYFGTPKQKFKFIVLPLLIMALSIAGGFVYWQAVWLIYMGWSLPHFVQQNAGILLLYHNHNRGEAIVNRDLEMKSQQAAGIFFYLVAIHRCSLASTPVAPFSLFIVGAAFLVFAACVGLYLWHLFAQLKQGAYLNMPAFLFWIVSVLFFVPFALPSMNFEVCWILPSLMHWWQYIGLNYVIVKCKYGSEEQTQYIPSKRPILFFVGFCGVILLVQYGTFLFFLNQYPQKEVMNIWNSAFLGLGMVHYLLDGFIWKFREPHNREAVLVPLLNARAQKPGAAS